MLGESHHNSLAGWIKATDGTCRNPLPGSGEYPGGTRPGATVEVFGRVYLPRLPRNYEAGRPNTDLVVIDGTARLQTGCLTTDQATPHGPGIAIRRAGRADRRLAQGAVPIGRG